MNPQIFVSTVTILIIGISISSSTANGQLFDQLFGSLGDSIRNGERGPGVIKNEDGLNVNVPGFYDMIKRGSSLGINVLSGLVKVERGDEAERSGLVSNGVRRPLSVRVFGIPVYERGIRIRDPNPPSTSFNSGADSSDNLPGDEEPKVDSIRANDIPAINDP